MCVRVFEEYKRSLMHSSVCAMLPCSVHVCVCSSACMCACVHTLTHGPAGPHQNFPDLEPGLQRRGLPAGPRRLPELGDQPLQDPPRVDVCQYRQACNTRAQKT